MGSISHFGQQNIQASWQTPQEEAPNGVNADFFLEDILYAWNPNIQIVTGQRYYDSFLLSVWFVIVTEKIWLRWCCLAVPAQLVNGDGAWARCWALRAGSSSNTASQEEVFGDFLFSSQGGPLWVLANHSYSATYQLSQLWVDLKAKQQKAKKNQQNPDDFATQSPASCQMGTTFFKEEVNRHFFQTQWPSLLSEIYT